jgi:hypothetical protein
VTTPRQEAHIRFDHFSFGTIRIDGSTCLHDIVIGRGDVRKRKKGRSKQFSDALGHTPLSIEEKSLGNAASSSSALVHTAECR